MSKQHTSAKCRCQAVCSGVVAAVLAVMVRAYAPSVIDRAEAVVALPHPDQLSALLYASHVERNGLEFFRLTCEQDLEGIVAKLPLGRYGEGWFMIRNTKYSQREGRRKLFERRQKLG
jgi:hypothetical protein